MHSNYSLFIPLTQMDNLDRVLTIETEIDNYLKKGKGRACS